MTENDSGEIRADWTDHGDGSWECRVHSSKGELTVDLMRGRDGRLEGFVRSFEVRVQKQGHGTELAAVAFQLAAKYGITNITADATSAGTVKVMANLLGEKAVVRDYDDQGKEVDIKREDAIRFLEQTPPGQERSVVVKADIRGISVSPGRQPREQGDSPGKSKEQEPKGQSQEPREPGKETRGPDAPARDERGPRGPEFPGVTLEKDTPTATTTQPPTQPPAPERDRGAGPHTPGPKGVERGLEPGSGGTPPQAVVFPWAWRQGPAPAQGKQGPILGDDKGQTPGQAPPAPERAPDKPKGPEVSLEKDRVPETKGPEQVPQVAPVARTPEEHARLLQAHLRDPINVPPPVGRVPDDPYKNSNIREPSDADKAKGEESIKQVAGFDQMMRAGYRESADRQREALAQERSGLEARLRQEGLARDAIDRELAEFDKRRKSAPAPEVQRRGLEGPGEGLYRSR